jgi:predicted GNAT family acetyltransferase
VSDIALRMAEDADAAALDVFLAQYAETSMFLRGNLAAHGLDNADHRHGTTYWLQERDGIVAVAACSNGGYLMCQAPEADSAFWQAAARVLEGRSINGMTGVPDQVDAWADALGLTRQAFSVKETEPLYRLDLTQIVHPKMVGLELRKPEIDDADMLADWFRGYAHDTGITPTDGASGEVAADVFTRHPAARILMRWGEAVAMTSLNAQVDGTVQVGGVYVSSTKRGQGFAGAVVALQLAELAVGTAHTAILFAANAAAARAYERIGFCRVGSYEVAILEAPLDVKGMYNVL